MFKPTSGGAIPTSLVVNEYLLLSMLHMNHRTPDLVVVLMVLRSVLIRVKPPLKCHEPFIKFSIGQLESIGERRTVQC